MPKGFSRGFDRARETHWGRLVAAGGLCLALGGAAAAADPPRVRRDPVASSAIELRVSPAPDPEAGLDLFQRIALFFERIFDDRPITAQLFDARDAGPARTNSVAELVFYPGPLSAGTVVINLDRLQVYRILGGGLAERYQEQSEAAVLARVGMAR